VVLPRQAQVALGAGGQVERQSDGLAYVVVEGRQVGRPGRRARRPATGRPRALPPPGTWSQVEPQHDLYGLVYFLHLRQ
jgi:hypothetical protein